MRDSLFLCVIKIWQKYRDLFVGPFGLTLPECEDGSEDPASESWLEFLQLYVFLTSLSLDNNSVVLEFLGGVAMKRVKHVIGKVRPDGEAGFSEWNGAFFSCLAEKCWNADFVAGSVWSRHGEATPHDQSICLAWHLMMLHETMYNICFQGLT